MSSKSIVIAALATLAALTAGCSNCSKANPAGAIDEPAASAPPASAPPASAPAASASASAPAVAEPAAPSTGAAVPVGTFTKFFPKAGQGGAAPVIKADKGAYAEAKLDKDGKEIAVLSIVDAQKLAFVKARFEESTDTLEGFPLMKVGDHQSTVLVKGRYQVKVASQTLDHDARKAILKTFDLKGLDAL